MDSTMYTRLQSEYKQEIDSLKEKIKQWDKFTSDYKIVQEKLNTLPKKLSHDVMVPFGSIAYMPGKLYHTNEVLVLLGDNWFTKCTADHAWGIADRRKKYTMEQLELEKQLLKEFETRYSLTESIQETNTSFVDIREDYDEEKLLEWKKARKERIEDGGERNRVEEQTQEKTHAEIWSRLEELEKEEEQELSSEERTPRKERTGHNERAIKEQSPYDNHSSETSTPTIVFKHTQVHYKNEDEENRNEDKNDNTMKCVDQLIYHTPADIYIHYNKQHNHMEEEDSNNNGVDKLTAVKKTSKTVQWADNVTIKDIPHAGITGVTQPLVEAFTGQVIEHGSNDTQILKNRQERPQKVSKFKAEKSKRSY